MQTFDAGELLGVVTSNSKLQADSVVEHRVHDNLSDGVVPKCSLVLSIVAFIIQHLLQVHFPLGAKVPYVLGRFADIQCGVTMALVICSNGCFRQAQVTRHLLQAQTRGLRVLPVVVDAAFRFPTDAVCQDLRVRYYDPVSDTGERVISCVTQLFEEIAIRMHPQDAVEVLDLCAANLRERLTQESLKRPRWRSDDDLSVLRNHLSEESDSESDEVLSLSEVRVDLPPRSDELLRRRTHEAAAQCLVAEPSTKRRRRTHVTIHVLANVRECDPEHCRKVIKRHDGVLLITDRARQRE